MHLRNTYQVSTYVTEDIADQIKAYAKRKRWSLAQTVREVLLDAIAKEQEVTEREPA